MYAVLLAHWKARNGLLVLLMLIEHFSLWGVTAEALREKIS